MEQRRTVLDEQGVFGVWQIFWGYVFQMVVYGGGFVQLWEKNLWCSKAGGAGTRQYFVNSS